jgi:hypothetical protein
MISGSWVSQAIYAAAKLGIADRVQDLPKSAQTLAAETNSHAPSLYRLLRALASIGIFAEDDQGRFGLTPLAELLQTHVPGSLRGWAIMSGSDWRWQPWGQILQSVQTGEVAFAHVFGMGAFEYFTQHPTAAQIFDQGMTSVSSALVPAVVASYDFSGIHHLVDVAGGHGSLLAAILQANPNMKGTLFDLPHVIEGAHQHGHLDQAGITDRCQWVAGNFFESVPSGGDAYLLKSIIHDWDDEQALIILKNCRQAMDNQGRLLLVEIVIPTGNQPSLGKFLDLEMLIMAGGRERTEHEYRALLAAAGFTLSRIVPTPSPIHVIEGWPI